MFKTLPTFGLQFAGAVRSRGSGHNGGGSVEAGAGARNCRVEAVSLVYGLAGFSVEAPALEGTPLRIVWLRGSAT